MTEPAAGPTLVERWLRAGDAGDLDAFDALLDPDVVVHAPMGLSSSGIAAEKAVWQDALTAMPDLRHEVQAVATSGTTVAVRTVVSGTLIGELAGIRGHGQRFRVDQAVFARVSGERIVEAWEIVDTAVLLRQLGATGD